MWPQSVDVPVDLNKRKLIGIILLLEEIKARYALLLDTVCAIHSGCNLESLFAAVFHIDENMDCQQVFSWHISRRNRAVPTRGRACQ